MLYYGVVFLKILMFTLSTGLSHNMAYNVLKSLRLIDRFLHAPLGNAKNHSIGELKGIMVDKIENLELPLAHMIPEGAGHIVLPIISIICLAVFDYRLALASYNELTKALVSTPYRVIHGDETTLEVIDSKKQNVICLYIQHRFGIMRYISINLVKQEK